MMDHEKIKRYFTHKLKARMHNCNGEGVLVHLDDVIKAVEDFLEENEDSFTETIYVEKPKHERTSAFYVEPDEDDHYNGLIQRFRDM